MSVCPDCGENLTDTTNNLHGVECDTCMYPEKELEDK